MVLSLMIVLTNAQTKVDTLTNDKVIELTKIGLQSSVIINKIKTSLNIFDVSTQALIELNKNEVLPEVINEMMKAENQKNASISNYIESKDPNMMHKSGIYYYNPADANNPLTKIQVIRVNYKTSSGGYGGFSSSSTSAIISGKESRQVITESSPTFYFYFNTENNSKADWYENAASPNEFALVKVAEIARKDFRIFKVAGGASNGFTSSSNEDIPQKEKIPFDFTEIREGVYKVTFKQALVKGEYCFVYSSATYKVFDFGIH